MQSFTTVCALACSVRGWQDEKHIKIFWSKYLMMQNIISIVLFTLCSHVLATQNWHFDILMLVAGILLAITTTLSHLIVLEYAEKLKSMQTESAITYPEGAKIRLEKECVVCMERPVECVFVDPECLHGVVCLTCAEKITECPVCRKTSEHIPILLTGSVSAV